MNFSEKLNDYMNTYHVSGKELAAACNLSASAISRFRTGKTIPEKDSDQLKSLSYALSSFINKKGLTESTISDYKNIYDTLNHLIPSKVNPATFIDNLNRLIETMNVNINKMAQNLSYDSSYISRIRNGQRTPSDITGLASGISKYIIYHYNDIQSRTVLNSLLSCNDNPPKDNAAYTEALTKWLCHNEAAQDNSIVQFLQSVRDFDLNDYIKSVHYDKIKVPTVPFSFPTSKHYYGIKEMRQGELDFFKSTALSKSKQDIFMYSDMPLEDMAGDTKFIKKWVMSIAFCIKKGLHVNMVHHLNRPFQEMMLGLAGWIPLYMTGQISILHKRNS